MAGGGRDEWGATTPLRASILEEPTHANRAWSVLIDVRACYAKKAMGGDRNVLRRELIRNHIAVAAPRSQQPDIQRLKDSTKAPLRATAPLGRIYVDPA